MKFAKSKMKFKGLKNMAKNEEMKTEFNVFKDVWNVYKKFYFVTDNNEFWDELVNECGKVRDKYKNSNLCSRLLMVIIQDLEERGKNDDH
ncbi:hypothetical protein G4916_00900 [Anaerostipes hadrus]|uniref:hypothetical protein n=1 Tax=Anaerostipes hadrus TaxID=649756 RepID=UPI00034CB68B|nr:hypothetical protein [Anaerostipes hadrus]NSH27999.1 hypothetical protein [Anaerostipes hadrus]NSH42292.1 hypothetical protein [Anaerostipes hadrus]BEG60082.1 hypothetical protein Ahadr17467_17120 [Anaerostipes hadrus ATCC 29173 = JCM 17467]